jgi:DNA-binding GntR family transcriptional regulator
MSQAGRIYTALKNEILSGELEAGTLLAESRIAARFGVSRTPVREALFMLAGDGLTTSLPRQGHLVRTVSLQEVLDAFLVREILEAEAAAQAIGRLTGEEIARLKELANLSETDDRHAVNREFHTTIARASGNRILADFVDQLLVLMQRVLVLDPYLQRWTEDGAQQELDIVKAMEAGDEAAARAATLRHIRGTQARILRRI